MQLALKQARKAALRGEVPVGAVVVCEGELISSGSNCRESIPSTLGHAELVALHRAQLRLKRWRLSDCTLYSTLEPCIMCAGALQQARLQRLVYAAADPKGGGVESLFRILDDVRLNHRVPCEQGLMAEESRELLQNFFKERRRK